jgi:hypothetical protein
MRCSLVLVSVLLLAACKGDRERCEQASRNYATLMFWKKANAEIAERPKAERDKLRKEKLALFTYEMESKIDAVVSQCQSANNDDQVECMIAAKTPEAAVECAELVPNDPQ